MRNCCGYEVAGCGVSQPCANTFRRAGPHDRKTSRTPLIYWHSELPPYDAEPMEAHVVEATSIHVPNTIAHGDELWDQCYENLMAQACSRIEQEIDRLGGNYAHVLNESVESRLDGATGESWMIGRFAYMLYRQLTNV